MNKFFFDEPVSPQDELINLLDYNKICYRKEVDGVRFVFAEGGYKWETICRYTQHTVLIYGLYPFLITDEDKALKLINRINAKLTRGGIFLQEGIVVTRTSADLFDAYSAYETIARALEYNAGTIVAFWQNFAVL